MKILSGALAFLIAFESATLPAHAAPGDDSESRTAPAVAQLKTSTFQLASGDYVSIEVSTIPLDLEDQPYESYEVVEEHARAIYRETFRANPKVESRLIVVGDAQKVIVDEGLSDEVASFARALHAKPEHLQLSKETAQALEKTQKKKRLYKTMVRFFFNGTAGLILGLIAQMEPVNAALFGLITGGGSGYLQARFREVTAYLNGNKLDKNKEVILDPETRQPISTYYVDKLLDKKGVKDPEVIRKARFYESVLRHLKYDFGYSGWVTGMMVIVTSLLGGHYPVDLTFLMIDSVINMLTQGSLESLATQAAGKEMLEIRNQVDQDPGLRKKLLEAAENKLGNRFVLISVVTTALFLGKQLGLPMFEILFWGVGGSGLAIRLGKEHQARKLAPVSCPEALTPRGE